VFAEQGLLTFMPSYQIREVNELRRIASIFSGLALGVAAVWMLLWAGTIEIPFMGSGRNTEWVLPILVAGLLVGGFMPDSALWRWGGPLLLLVALVLPGATRQYEKARSQAEITAQQRRVQEIKNQALRAAQMLEPGGKAELGHSRNRPSTPTHWSSTSFARPMACG